MDRESLVQKAHHVPYPQIQVNGNRGSSTTALLIVICFELVAESNNTGKCNKMFQNLLVLVHLLGGHKEANLKAMCSDQETAGSGSNLIQSNQEWKVYFE